jgi:hypothetical protein
MMKRINGWTALRRVRVCFVTCLSCVAIGNDPATQAIGDAERDLKLRASRDLVVQDEAQLTEQQKFERDYQQRQVCRCVRCACVSRRDTGRWEQSDDVAQREIVGSARCGQRTRVAGHV